MEYCKYGGNWITALAVASSSWGGGGGYLCRETVVSQGSQWC